MINQLYDIYLNEEYWHKTRLTYDQFKDYTLSAMESGSLFVRLVENKVVGYCEFYRLNYEQLGRVLCEGQLYPDKEPLMNGDIAYIYNLYISSPNFMPEMKAEFFRRIAGCKYISGKRVKRTQPFSIYKIESNFKKDVETKQGVANGK